MEFRCAQVRHVQAHHDLRGPAEPPTGRRARDSEIRGEGDVPRASNEIPKAVVVALLRAGSGRHEHDDRSVQLVAELESPSLGDDISRIKVQNVRMRSAAELHCRRKTEMYPESLWQNVSIDDAETSDSPCSICFGPRRLRSHAYLGENFRVQFSKASRVVKRVRNFVLE